MIKVWTSYLPKGAGIFCEQTQGWLDSRLFPRTAPVDVHKNKTDYIMLTPMGVQIREGYLALKKKPPRGAPRLDAGDLRALVPYMFGLLESKLPDELLGAAEAEKTQALFQFLVINTMRPSITGACMLTSILALLKCFLLKWFRYLHLPSMVVLLLDGVLHKLHMNTLLLLALLPALIALLLALTCVGHSVPIPVILGDGNTHFTVHPPFGGSMDDIVITGRGPKTSVDAHTMPLDTREAIFYLTQSYNARLLEKTGIPSIATCTAAEGNRFPFDSRMHVCWRKQVSL
jgi:hypothetical protein